MSNVNIPMLTLNGVLMNTYMGNAYVDKETGETTPAALKIQMLCDVPQKSGGIKKELVTMSAKDETHYELYESFAGKMIRVGVGVIPQGRNLNFWILPNTSPQLAEEMPASPKPAAAVSVPPVIKSPLGN